MDRKMVKFLKSNSFTLLKGTGIWYTKIDNFPVNASMWSSQYYTGFDIYFPPISEDEVDRMKTEVLKGMKEDSNKAIRTYEIKRDRVTIVFTDKKVRDEALILTFLHDITEVLQKNGIQDASYCYNCCKENKDGLAVFGNHVKSVCEDCAQEIKDVQKSRSLVSGILGGILGAVVGALPIVLAGWLLNLVSMWLALLVGYACFAGYSLFKGRINKGTPWVVAIISTVVLIPTFIALYGLIIWKEGITWALFLDVLSYNSELQGEFLLDIIKFFGFGIGGVLVAIPFVSRKAKEKSGSDFRRVDVDIVL